MTTAKVIRVTKTRSSATNSVSDVVDISYVGDDGNQIVRTISRSHGEMQVGQIVPADITSMKS